MNIREAIKIIGGAMSPPAEGIITGIVLALIFVAFDAIRMRREEKYDNG